MKTSCQGDKDLVFSLAGYMLALGSFFFYFLGSYRSMPSQEALVFFL